MSNEKGVDVNALELADWCDDLFSSDGEPKEAAEMLRKQDAAIRQLREALRPLITKRMGAEQIREGIQRALAATEEWK